jgi:hypothetical protein
MTVRPVTKGNPGPAPPVPEANIMSEQSRARNLMEVPLTEFRRAIKVFGRKRLILGPALLSFEGGFLSIESSDVTAVMRASGEWHGRATFSPEILRAVATVPPSQDPLPIAYADGHLLIGPLPVPCQWHLLSQALVDDLENPSFMDLLVLERTLSRSELKGSNLGRRIRAAVPRAEMRIQRAAAELVALDVTVADVRALVDAKIATRLKPIIGEG